MPEGHTIHAAARDQMRDLGGAPVAVTSPQGRSADTAAELDGLVLRRIDAHGKHLLYRFAPATEGRVRKADQRTLHVHLGLFGKFFRQASPPRDPTGQKRLRMVGEAWTIDLSGATICELLPPPVEAKLLARLGPDPLRRDGDPALFLAALSRRKISIAEALMDQSVVAGIGNVYRAEALHAERMHPHRAANSLSEDEGLALWVRMQAQLKQGLGDGMIVTIPDAPRTSAARRRIPRAKGKCVYKRVRCYTCGGPVSSEPLAGRTLWWCPHDQPV
ncbi:MAG: DNA-formamidopyrimidine glycosylase family protein [Solirubrobacteraceae bacterium]|nr:DNA-formamidopyrimidine glycosylase family protein [Solirubrobacteraceae bacterium]